MFTKEFIELGRIAAESAIETLITKAKNETGAEISFNEMLQMTKQMQMLARCTKS